MNISPVNLQNQVRFTGQEDRKKHNFLDRARNSLTTLSGHEIVSTLKPQTSKLTRADRKAVNEIKSNMSRESKKLYTKAQNIAQYSHSPELKSWHLYLATLQETKDFIVGMDEDTSEATEDANLTMPLYLEATISKNFQALSNKKTRKKIVKVLNNHIQSMQKEYVKENQKKYPQKRLTSIPESKELVEDLKATWNKIVMLDDNSQFYDKDYMFLGFNSQDKKLKKEVRKLGIDIKKAALLKEPSGKEKHHIEFFDKKADLIWKNIANGNNVVVTNNKENQSSYSYLINSFKNLINKPGQKYGDLTPQATEIIELNENADMKFLGDLARDIKQDSTKIGTTTVIIGDFTSLLTQSNGQINVNTLELLQDEDDSINSPKVKFVMSFSPESYQLNIQKGGLFGELLEKSSQQKLPILNAQDTEKYLTNDNGLAFIQAQTGKEIEGETVKKAIQITSSQEGYFPEKLMKLLNSVSKYFSDQDKITEEQINQYLKETEDLNETSNIGTSNITFETGKTTDDIKGMPMTKEQAELLVRRIKNNAIGTRGIIIQHANGGAYGGGRKHTIESIAGTLGIPMIKVNAKDFALKDIDALSQRADLSEIKIKKLISTAKAQAEANKLNTAIIFIENFENFASDSKYGISSIYEQKAFSQLLEEMENIRQQGKTNILVVGSTSMPEAMDQNIIKPYKFIDHLDIYQPKNHSERKEILEYYIDKDNLEIAGDTKEEKDKVLNKISETTQGFTVVDLIYLLQETSIISKDRGKDKIDTADFTEAYLRQIAGMVNNSDESDLHKKIVTSHETGHATNQQIMYDLMKKQNKLWKLPRKVNFITLDSRGDFGAAVFSKDSDNKLDSFETVISDIVVDYGGNSAESILYGMNGSTTITSDMEAAEQMAMYAVAEAGMGYNTGVRHVSGNFMSGEELHLINQDVDNILKTGKKISDEIAKAYKGFIEEFTENHYRQTGTGNCIITSEEFKQELRDWQNRQTGENKEKLEALEKTILKDIENCKCGDVNPNLRHKKMGF